MAAQGPQSRAPRQRLGRLLPMAGFQLSMYGRFWVSTEARIAVLWHPGTVSAVPGLKALGGAGTGAFSTMSRAGEQAALVFSTPPFITARQRIAELAIAHRLPTMCRGRLFVEAGGLVYVDKILRGAKPADLPGEQVTKLELVINLRQPRR